jgi:carboxymethylenebutenolidase
MRSLHLLATLLGLALTAAQAHAAPCKVATVVDGVFSGGKLVRVERFEPKGTGPWPAVVLLHGLDGLPDRGGVYRGVARRLAARGYVVLLVRYFDRTGTKKGDLPDLLKRFRACLDETHRGGKRWQEVRATFAAWLATVADVLAHARKLSRVDPNRVGLVGFSMGGFLATASAMRLELRIACVVELFGGLPAELAAGLKHMPPTLILHGDRDDVVPLKHARALHDHLVERCLPVEGKVYDNTGHGFRRPDGGVQIFAALDAERRATCFLATHLGTSLRTAAAPGT